MKNQRMTKVKQGKQVWPQKIRLKNADTVGVSINYYSAWHMVRHAVGVVRPVNSNAYPDGQRETDQAAGRIIQTPESAGARQ